jgi:hypothetical protein
MRKAEGQRYLFTVGQCNMLPEKHPAGPPSYMPPEIHSCIRCTTAGAERLWLCPPPSNRDKQRLWDPRTKIVLGRAVGARLH